MERVDGKSSYLYMERVSYCTRNIWEVGYSIIHSTYCPSQVKQLVNQVQLYAQPRLLLSPNSIVIVPCDAALLYSTCIDAPGGIEVVPAFRSRDDNRSRIIRH